MAKEIIEIKKDNALKAYNAGCPDVKKVLENLLGTDTFVPINIMDQVKTFKDACDVCGIDYHAELDRLSKHSQTELAMAKLITIAKALNEGWKPDWKNSSQRKYYPWFDLSSGSGLRFYGCDYRDSISVVGSRLCFKTEELAKYAGTQFIDIYTEFFIK